LSDFHHWPALRRTSGRGRRRQLYDHRQFVGLWTISHVSRVSVAPSQGPTIRVIGAAAKSERKAKRGTGLTGKPRLVPIVEDEGMLHADIADEFRSSGWRVLEADTAEDAIEFVRGGPRVDVIFTDIQLSGRLSGWDVAEQCRNLLKDVAVVRVDRDGRRQPLPVCSDF
jgi:CheY-like chemotaxis protein